ncbi:unnamed protein product, partial [Brachionus calyciflorus]
TSHSGNSRECPVFIKYKASLNKNIGKTYAEALKAQENITGKKILRTKKENNDYIDANRVKKYREIYGEKLKKKYSQKLEPKDDENSENEEAEEDNESDEEEQQPNNHIQYKKQNKRNNNKVKIKQRETWLKENEELNNNLFENEITYMKSGMTNYTGDGTPYGGIGWIVKKYLNEKIKLAHVGLERLGKTQLKCFKIDNIEKVMYTYANAQHKSLIDHVVSSVDSNQNIVKINIIDPDILNQSDHLPIKTTLKLKINKCLNKISKKQKKTIKIDWNNINTQLEYAEKLESEIHQNNSIGKLNADKIDKSDLDKIVNKLHSSMRKCCQDILTNIMKHKIKRKSKDLWDEEIEKIHTDMKKQLCEYKASGYKNFIIKKKYKRLKKQFRYLQRKNLNREYDKFVNLLKEEEENLKKATDKIEQYESLIDKSPPEFFSIERNDVKKILEKLPNGKSPGFGEVTNEMFKYGITNTLVELITTLMEKINNSGIIHNFFNIGKILPVIKDENKDNNDPKNIRPITVSDTLANIFEKLILLEINRTHKSIPNQFGFTNNSSFFKTTIGVKQGGPLSPKLFAFYIEEIVKLIEQEDLGVKIMDQQIGILLYADDILILSDEVSKIERAIRICEEFGKQNEIKFNPEKTRLITFGNKKWRTQKVKLFMNEKEIESIDKIKYLGAIVNSKNNNEDHIQQRIKNTMRSLNSIKTIGIDDE